MSYPGRPIWRIRICVRQKAYRWESAEAIVVDSANYEGPNVTVVSNTASNVQAVRN